MGQNRGSGPKHFAIKKLYLTVPLIVFSSAVTLLLLGGWLRVPAAASDGMLSKHSRTSSNVLSGEPRGTNDFSGSSLSEIARASAMAVHEMEVSGQVAFDTGEPVEGAAIVVILYPEAEQIF